jgi:hypothetical protein
MTIVERRMDAASAGVARALIEEARQHQRRRRAWIAGIITLIVLSGGAISWWARGNPSRQLRPFSWWCRKYPKRSHRRSASID